MMNHQSKKIDRVITRITSIITIIVIISLSAWGISSYVHLQAYEETNDAQIEMYINPITAKVGGYITAIRFRENQEVHKGDTLIIIDNSDYVVQKQEADASVENARAQIGILNSNITTARMAITVNESQESAAKARLWKAQQEYQRYKNLYGEESATKQQLEYMESALQVAQADYDASIQSRRLSLSKVADIKTQQIAALTEIDRRKAISRKNGLTISYTVIVAPYSGKMGRRTIQPGQLIQAGQPLAFIVDEEAGKWVIANFKEMQVGQMQTGQEVTITVDAFPGSTFHGKIESLSAATGSRFSVLPPDNATGNFVKIAQRIPVRIRLTDREADLARLYAGMNANVSIKK
jgi:membrane fusion protein (multidrug efflux system)